jgi:antitoxin FitA
MPITISIRDVPDELANRLRERARRNHRSLQGELMAMMESATDAPGLREDQREYQAEQPAKRRLTIQEVSEWARKRGPLRTDDERARESVVEMVRRMRDERTEHIEQVLEKARRK